MQKIGHSVKYYKKDWDLFFKNLGNSWRYKDYITLEEVFNIKKFYGHLLEVGCGLGDGIDYLSKRCKMLTRITGIDYSDYAIEQCKKRFGHKKGMEYNFFQADIHETLKDQADVVICLQTLEHLGDPIKALNNLLNATNDLLIISTPYNNRRFDESHIWSFDEKDFPFMNECKITHKSKSIFWFYSKKTNYCFRKFPILYHYLIKFTRLFHLNYRS